MSTAAQPATSQAIAEYDAVVIGAGIAGLYQLYRLREMGLRVCALDAAADVGGTWWENTYPGCRVDVPNHFYSYSFALNPEWSLSSCMSRPPRRWFRPWRMVVPRQLCRTASSVSASPDNTTW